VKEEVEDGEQVLDPANTSSAMNTVLSTLNNEFEQKSLDQYVSLPNAHSIRQSKVEHIPGHKYSIPGLPGMRLLAHQVWAIWFIVRRWIWYADMLRALVADEMGLGKTFSLVSVAMLWKLVTEIVVMGLPLSIVWGMTLTE
jgi:hypothetical protein